MISWKTGDRMILGIVKRRYDTRQLNKADGILLTALLSEYLDAAQSLDDDLEFDRCVDVANHTEWAMGRQIDVGYSSHKPIIVCGAHSLEALTWGDLFDTIKDGFLVKWVAAGGIG